MNIVNVILRIVWERRLTQKECGHLDQVGDPSPSAEVCEECVTVEDTWPDLRMCTVCGYVGCCDGSKNKHMMKHYEATGHPIIKPYNSRMTWMWCYPDKALLG